MNAIRQAILRAWACLAAGVLVLSAGGCSDGKDGLDGAAGAVGPPGNPGLSCWDLNQNGIKDFPDEDINGDGLIDVEDCRTPSGAYDPAGLHAGYFREKTYTGTADCLDCHGKMADEFLQTAHCRWEGLASNIEGFEAATHGKKDIINNFCIAVPSNEGRCTQCHAGYGWADKTFDFGDTNNIDCLVCHDQTGTYKKAPPSAGIPDPAVDLQKVAQSVGVNGGVPTRKACLFCHQNAGGGDNVKHGDLSSDLIATTAEYDVHMGTDSLDFSCVRCHGVKRDADGRLVSHGIGGMPYHSIEEGDLKTCEDCHGGAAGIHAGTSAQNLVNSHTALACQVCQIPAIARKVATKTEWYWSDAGDADRVPLIDPETERPDYDKMKGSFVWKKSVRPELRYFDGKWRKTLIGVNDTFPATAPAVLAEPAADRFTPGTYVFAETEMLLSVNHEVAPAKQALDCTGDPAQQVGSCP